MLSMYANACHQLRSCPVARTAVELQQAFERPRLLHTHQTKPSFRLLCSTYGMDASQLRR